MKRLSGSRINLARKRMKKDRIADGTVALQDTHGAPTQDSPPFEGSLPRLTATELYAFPEDKVIEGYIQVKCHMKWPPRDSMRVQVETKEGDATIRFEIELQRPCLDYLIQNDLLLGVGDKFSLALDGARVERRYGSKRMTESRTILPMRLLYQEGIRLQFLESRDSRKAGVLIDTVTSSSTQPEQDDAVPLSIAPPASHDWFLTPTSPEVRTVVGVEVDPSQSPFHEAGSPSVSALPASVQEDGADAQCQPHLGSLARLPANRTGSPVTRSEAIEADRISVFTDQPVSTVSSSRSISESSIRQVGGKVARSTSGSPPVKRLYRDTKKSARDRPTAKADNQTGSTVSETATAHRNGIQQQERPGASAHGSKKAEKKAKREAKRHVVAQAVIPPDNGNIPHTDLEVQTTRAEPPASDQLDMPTNVTADGTPTKQAQTMLTDQERTQGDITALAISDNNNHSPTMERDPALDLQPGCYPTDSMEQYPPLRDLVANSRLNLIGVILSVQNKPTNSGQFMSRLLLIDPSTYSSHMPENGFGVNCFTHEELDNITGARKGDIVLLRRVQIDEKYGNKNGVCGSLWAWSWALFSPESGTVTPGAASSRTIFKPSQAELNYCIQLGDWWRAVQEQQEHLLHENGGSVHNLADIYMPKRLEREHRLIADASPAASPNGYFDCTAEVLKTHRNDNGVWSVYITDYTSNENLPVVDASWSDSSLAHRILKVEMWDAAADVAASMQSGEYYCIRNIRMRESRGGYWEGKCVEVEGDKIRRLDDDELENKPHLKLLLERKKKWEEIVVERRDTEGFSHKLFQQAELDEHFNCTVHVLHVSLKENGKAFIYVTDYTPRKDLADIPATARWAGTISDDRIVKIALSDAAVEVAKALNSNDYIAIRNLRLKSFLNGGGNVSGRLGGDEPLIFRLDPADSGNTNLPALLRRQKEWEKRINSSHPTVASSKGSIRRPKVVTPKKDEFEAFTIKEMLEYEGPSALFEPVIARIVDFWPENLVDCVILRCTQCDEEIPENLQICTKCDDSMDTHVRPLYRFGFEIEDESGDRLRVSAAHPQCNLLKDLPPTDLREDDDALEAFTDRLRPFLGKLITEHSRLIDGALGERVHPDWDQPLLEMSIAGALTENSAHSMQFYFMNMNQTPLV